MNKMLNKLGVYDILAVLMSGIVISTFSAFILRYIYYIKIPFEWRFNQIILILIASYFCGILFQESGSFIQKKLIFRKNGLLKKALSVEDNDHGRLTLFEKEKIYKYVKHKLKLKKDNHSVIYNYCKFYLLKNGKIEKIEKDQSLSAMSRSLSLYFAILTVFAFITFIFDLNLTKLALMFCSMLFSVVLYYRSVRFAIIRYTNIFRTFYYDCACFS